MLCDVVSLWRGWLAARVTDVVTTIVTFSVVYVEGADVSTTLSVEIFADGELMEITVVNETPASDWLAVVAVATRAVKIGSSVCDVTLFLVVAGARVVHMYWR